MRRELVPREMSLKGPQNAILWKTKAEQYLTFVLRRAEIGLTPDDRDMRSYS